MATSDDPPFLNVGTEVSAKYRGAFCEATIKIAKKIVKCKISYTKGQTDTVPNDLIKGPLKIGANVEVRQSDGQYLSGTIQKLTDASTYTVVFDDGDERTLKRSSLCLKGGRHYSASESLDQMPLTDPENFGTPAHFQSKRGTRRRRHMSQSSSPEAESESPIKNPPASRYPAEYPVGKCVFLENDRRRAGWVPGVIVPAHYVMDESEMTVDTICIRSFKDGRFFAAKTSELHDFAPDKEPLCSMLDGEIQGMYMCKPAIERAMAYLDTNELPWNMDLFGDNEDHNSLHATKDSDEGACEDKSTVEEQKQEVEEFLVRLAKFQEDKGTVVNKKPSLAGKDLDLYKLYHLVKENGGTDRITQELKWRSLYMQMGMPQVSNSSHLIKQAYKKYLHGFEVYEKARLDGKPLPVRNKRRPTVHESDEDLDKQSKAGVDQDLRKKPKDTSNVSVGSPSSGAETGGEDFASIRNALNFGEYKVGDRVNVLYGKGKAQTTYEAKIINADQITAEKVLYLVHYNGWNTRYDEWIENDRITGRATGPGGRHSGRASYSKKKHSRLRSNKPNHSDSQVESSSTGSPGGPVAMITETLSSYSSGSESGPVKTPKSAGDVQRRRMSSATETSTCSGSNSDNPQSPDTTPHSTYLQPHPQSNSSSLFSKHPLAKQYPLSPPVSSAMSFASPPRVPLILSPEGSHETISLRAPPQEDCRDLVMECQQDSEHHQLLIKKEKNIEFVEEEIDDVTSHGSSRHHSSDQDEANCQEDMVEMTSCKTKEEDLTHLSTPSPSGRETSSVTSSTQPERMETSSEHQQHLDAAYSLMQVTSTISPVSLSSASPCMSVCTHTVSSSSASNDSTQPFACPVTQPLSSPVTQPLSPPVTQSENSSIASSSTESEHELSMILLDSKRSSSFITPDISQQDDEASPRKRKGGGHDSGVENGSESDGPESKFSRNDLDFSIDMTDLNGLSTTERIGKILDRMKEIQKRYMELKAEVTYLDRKRRRARRKEREAAKHHIVSPSLTTPPSATPHSSSLPQVVQLQQQQTTLTDATAPQSHHHLLLSTPPLVNT